MNNLNFHTHKRAKNELESQNHWLEGEDDLKTDRAESSEYLIDSTCTLQNAACCCQGRTLLRSSVFYPAAKSLMKLRSFGEDIPCHTWHGLHASACTYVCMYYALLQIAPLNGPLLSSAKKTSQRTHLCNARVMSMRICSVRD